jgi:hypothetical protein
VGIALDGLPETPRVAWTQLRDELRAILGDDLVAIWAYGGTIAPEPPLRPADLDTHVIVKRAPDADTARRIQHAMSTIEKAAGMEWDTWFIGVDDARQPHAPPHAFLEGRRDTSWALHRAHWLAGTYVNIHGPDPADIVLAPTWTELEVDLVDELEHLERHVAHGDTDPYEAAYAILNGSRIVHSFETRDVVLSKRAAGQWALAHLPPPWHNALHAAIRAYDGQATPDDSERLAREMGQFVAMVRERLP